MATATRTTNPLHFEDLEPHRFEDLVRQLIYDFREWHQLEATGRSGSDEGFDIRAREIQNEGLDEGEEDGEESKVQSSGSVTDRIWLVQCKREKVITPKKLVAYLKGTKAAVYGLIFVAPCEFSKKARDEFREWCVKNSVADYYLWGRSELEDLLFQPRYDHLLFAYFGISLQIRRRSFKTRLRGILAAKRQAVRHLGRIAEYQHKSVLIRDPDAKEYPYKEDIANFDERPRWWVYFFIGHYYDGLKFLIKVHRAYLEGGGSGWDYEDRIRLNQPFDNPWLKDRNSRDLQSRAWQFWKQLPDDNRATLEVIGLVRYEDIIIIDEHGDEHFEDPHLYVNFDELVGPFSGGVYWKITTDADRKEYYISPDEHRVKFFPAEYPETIATDELPDEPTF